MSEKHLDHPGEITWTKEARPASVIGPCPHDCDHTAQSVIAFGPDERHYELIECLGECDGKCRAWTDGSVRTTSPWLQLDVQEETR